MAGEGGQICVTSFMNIPLPSGEIFVLNISFNLAKADKKNFASGFPTTSAFTSAEYSRPVIKHPAKNYKQ